MCQNSICLAGRLSVQDNKFRPSLSHRLILAWREDFFMCVCVCGGGGGGEVEACDGGRERSTSQTPTSLSFRSNPQTNKYINKLVFYAQSTSAVISGRKQTNKTTPTATTTTKKRKKKARKKRKKSTQLQ